jgi:hypothetical protein
VTEWQYFNGAAFVPVALWPHPNTLRINPRYRCIETQPTMIRLASRYGLYYHLFNLPYSEDPQELFGFWWGDLLVKGDNHIGVTTEENKDGYTLDIDVKHFESLPFAAEPGYEFKTTWHKAGLNSRSFTEEFPTSFPGNKWRHNMNTKFTAQEGDSHWEFPPQPVVTQFTSILFAVNECFLFPKLPVGFASFNGINAYIELTESLGMLDQPFKISADIRLHNTTGFWPLIGRDGQGGFLGMDDNDTIFGFLRLVTSWTPVLDVWFNWRFEFEQVSQLNYRTFIDDVQVDETTGGRQFSLWDILGVYKHGVSGTIWSDMDVKNLKILTGDVPSTDVLLDMPLEKNALDVGPNLNHGTTFNMDLPSV